MPQTEWLKPKAFISHSSGGQEVQNHVSTFGSCEGSVSALQMADISLYLHMADGDRGGEKERNSALLSPSLLKEEANSIIRSHLHDLI